MRATNLQELVYKNGQAGITKATVSITFDNADKKQSPLGYEQYDEITITRQVCWRSIPITHFILINLEGHHLKILIVNAECLVYVWTLWNWRMLIYFILQCIWLNGQTETRSYFFIWKMQNNERNLKIGHNWFGMMSEWNDFIPNFLYNSKNTTCTWKVICF